MTTTLSTKLNKILRSRLKDVKAKKNLSPAFTNAKDAAVWLKK